MPREIQLIQRLAPKPLAYHTAKAWGFTPPPMLVTFRDASGAVRREMVPL